MKLRNKPDVRREAIRLSSFGEWLVRVRISRGLTQQALADATRSAGDDGVSVNTISNWEKGDVDSPHFEKLRCIAGPLGVDPSEIFEVVAAARTSEAHAESFLSNLEGKYSDSKK